MPCAALSPPSSDPASTARQRSWYRRRCSIATALLDQQICSRQSAHSKDLLPASGKVRPMLGTRLRLRWDDSADHVLALAQFHSFSGAQPRLQATRITQLTDVDRWHDYIVPQNVAHSKELYTSASPAQRRRSFPQPRNLG